MEAVAHHGQSGVECFVLDIIKQMKISRWCSVHKPSYIFLGILEDNESPDQIKMLQLSERECKNIESEMEWKGSDQVDLEQTWTELNSRLQRRLKTKKWELED
ncbi:hypothetical protein MLD38_012211 [Melastoma candidum]|uniref:Uncharacterized protein n=1 Tax=Melastoma candidum TaxID=119954 RepID=A0ACB9R522_9MYRT|nr:hypothetical protein MLD38_012211 [Melastoma candidum]